MDSCPQVSHRLIFQTKNADFFKHYVTEDFNEYLNRKRIDSAHGNHIEMQAISELYNRPVEVYQYSLYGMVCYQASVINCLPKVQTGRSKFVEGC